jgi:hypothetical protein
MSALEILGVMVGIGFAMLIGWSFGMWRRDQQRQQQWTASHFRHRHHPPKHLSSH